jgi:hypothetical protein
VIDYVVKAGDCLSSIAHRYGFTWQALWNDPANASLKALRKNPNILFPGDVVHVPEKTPKDFPASPKVWNRFKVDREVSTLKLRLRINGSALAHVPFTLAVDGGPAASGMTDADGKLEMPVPADGRHAELRVADAFTYRLRLGDLDPLETSKGLQARLAQLGFYAGALDGIVGSYTKAAIRFFQLSVGIPPTGNADNTTLDALRSAFGC